MKAIFAMFCLLLTNCGNDERKNINAAQPASLSKSLTAQDIDASLNLLKNAKNYPLDESLLALTNIVRVSFFEFNRLQAVDHCQRDQDLFEELRVGCTLALYFFGFSKNRKILEDAYRGLEWAYEYGTKRQQITIAWILGTNAEINPYLSRQKVLTLLHKFSLPLSLRIAIIEQYYLARKSVLMADEKTALRSLLLTFARETEQNNFSVGMSLQILRQLDEQAFANVIQQHCSSAAKLSTHCQKALEAMTAAAQWKHETATNPAILYRWAIHNDEKNLLENLLQIPRALLSTIP